MFWTDSFYRKKTHKYIRKSDDTGNWFTQENKIPLLSIPTDHDPNNTHFGDEAAEKLGLDPHQSFKTLLVAENGDQKKLACFVLSTANMLSLKKAAKSIGVKKSWNGR